ncbi:MAG: hypothetical protein AB1512_11925 [Thermodesulfobacteriota bacterium]
MADIQGGRRGSRYGGRPRGPCLGWIREGSDAVVADGVQSFAAGFRPRRGVARTHGRLNILATAHSARDPTDFLGEKMTLALAAGLWDGTHTVLLAPYVPAATGGTAVPDRREPGGSGQAEGQKQRKNPEGASMAHGSIYHTFAV